jgi:hypothetical protein
MPTISVIFYKDPAGDDWQLTNNTVPAIIYTYSNKGTE